MGPKKDAKNVVEEPPKQVEPQPLPFEIVGYGRFEYLNGVTYQGNWKIIKGIKVKQGYGRLTLPLQLHQEAGEEYYEGNWQQDKMAGFGTYYYPDGSIYTGQWFNNKHHGRGKFTLANGTHYEGQWQNHLMNGVGCFIDHLGRKWQGQFREGVFESRKQMELSKEKALEERVAETKAQVKTTIQRILELLGKDQKAEDKINLFFASSDYVKNLIKDDLLSFKSKDKSTWYQILKECVNGEIKILQSRSQCKTINGERILVRQQQGEGQVAQVFFTRGSKKNGLLFLQIEASRWIIAAANEDLA